MEGEFERRVEKMNNFVVGIPIDASQVHRDSPLILESIVAYFRKNS